MNIDLFDFYKNRNVLITGHTGFKGTWMTRVLLMLGANVTGYSLTAPTNPSMYSLLGLDMHDKEVGASDDEAACLYSGTYRSVIGDIRDLKGLKKAFDLSRPEIVIHMAAQPIVRQSYIDPVGTYETNVLGTVNVLECCRTTSCVKSVVNVTTDKVYRNKERSQGYREEEELCGYDPYSNSKSCSELVTDSYRNSFFNDIGISVTTMRAGNVIGGGDFAKDRIIPDCVRACEEGRDIIVRNPYSTRPYQHVLEPVICYLKMAAIQLENPSKASAYNIGPNDADAVTTGQITTMFCNKWNDINKDGSTKWVNVGDNGPHEATYLKLDCTKIKEQLGWNPKWDIDVAMDKVVEWYSAYLSKEDIDIVTDRQIKEYLS